MSIRTLIFILFLYVCLVWIAAFGLRTGPEIEPFGLLWTAAGIIAVLALVILSWVFGVWRSHRAKVRQKPPAPEKPAPVTHPDDAAISALIRDANSALAKISAVRDFSPGGDFRRLPLYLLIGPAGTGKTSTFANAGFEPHWLAGNAADARRPGPTVLMNLWFSGGAIFAELSGQAFSGSGETWLRLLRALRGEDRRPLWRRVLRDKQTYASLGGVIGFCHARDLIGASADPQRLETASRLWKDRLKSITEIFGTSFPIHQVFTNSDSLPYFNDFFLRLPDSEIQQVFGSAVPPVSETLGETREHRMKRLVNSFRDLYKSVVERCVLHLALEANMKLRPGIYEFPRELKRIRSALVEFLTDAIEFSPLELGPRLHGYYLTATRETGAVPASVPASDEPSSSNMEASRFFRGDATNIFRTDDFNAVLKPAGGRTVQWLFAVDIFRTVLPAATVAVRVSRPVRDQRVERFRLITMAATVAVCFLLNIGFAISWSGNRSLLTTVQAAAQGIPPSGQIEPTLIALRSLDRLRVALQGLSNSPGLSMHMGLYAGNRIEKPLRTAYFDRVQHLLLNGINSRMVETLQAGDTTDANLLYNILKTHLMITSGGCEPDVRLVSDVLNREDRTPAYEADPVQWQVLARRQVDYYAAELKYGNPCHLSENTVACGRAREALQRIRGVSGFYADLISRAGQSAAKTRLGDLAPGYERTLTGPADVSPAFSASGRDIVVKGAKDFHVNPVDACALGSRSASKTDVNEIQATYVRDYIENWRKYLAGFEVVRYKNAQDAASKLTLLADHKSPLLALFALTSDSTDFKPSAASAAKDLGSKYLDKVFGNGPSAKTSENARRPVDGDFHEIALVFQPVQWVVAPGGETWVSERNSGYLEALAQLGHSMQDIADNKNPGDPALFQAASQNYEKALDTVRQMAKGFKPAEVGGVDSIAQRLLQEPIEYAKNFIVDPIGGQKNRIETQFQSLCRTIGPALRKYPFQNSSVDLPLADFTSAFAPGTGAISKFEAEALGDVLVKDGAAWKIKDPAQKLLPTPRLLTFVNRAQAVTNAFFPAGATAPRLVYVLRPRPETGSRNLTIELEVDGQQHQWTNSYQAPFTWPAAPGAKPGAVARAGDNNFAAGFAAREGVWGIFRIIGDAEPRPLQSAVIEWKYTRGNNGSAVEIKPAPIRLEFVEFPGGADVFNPQFYEGLQCSGNAVQ